MRNWLQKIGFISRRDEMSDLFDELEMSGLYTDLKKLALQEDRDLLDLIEELVRDDEIECPFERGHPSKRIPPKAPGIYRFWNTETCEIDYYGVSINLYSRKRDHKRSGLLTSIHEFQWQKAKDGATIESLYVHEIKQIAGNQCRQPRALFGVKHPGNRSGPCPFSAQTLKELVDFQPFG